MRLVICLSVAASDRLPPYLAPGRDFNHDTRSMSGHMTGGWILAVKGHEPIDWPDWIPVLFGDLFRWEKETTHKCDIAVRSVHCPQSIRHRTF
jgi:hypothetical protein